jgi:predicted phosphatase
MVKKNKKLYKGPKYPTEAYGKIPAFSSYEEEADFWDTHSVTDFEDEFEEVDIVFELDKPKTESLVVRLQRDLKNKLKKVAKKKGVTVSTLSRIWLTEKLQSSS